MEGGWGARMLHALADTRGRCVEKEENATVERNLEDS